jgi:hypothetical protein
MPRDVDAVRRLLVEAELPAAGLLDQFPSAAGATPADPLGSAHVGDACMRLSAFSSLLPLCVLALGGLAECSTHASVPTPAPAVLLVTSAQHPLAGSAARDASPNRQPEVRIRPQEPDEAYDYLLYTLQRMPFFRQNGYSVALPADAAFEALADAGAPVPDADRARLREVFTKEVYREADFAAGLRALDGAASVFRQVFPIFASFATKWGFKVFPRYEVLLTLYGPGGSYDAERGRVTLFTTTDGKFKRANGVEVIVHEMVHIGIEEVIVERFGLEHWEKEGLVDRMCAIGLRTALPGYVVQAKGMEKFDQFVTEGALDDLPAAIARYADAKRRP